MARGSTRRWESSSFSMKLYECFLPRYVSSQLVDVSSHSDPHDVEDIFSFLFLNFTVTPITCTWLCIYTPVWLCVINTRTHMYTCIVFSVCTCVPVLLLSDQMLAYLAHSTTPTSVWTHMHMSHATCTHTHTHTHTHTLTHARTHTHTLFNFG